MELGLLPTGAQYSRIEGPVRRLRALLGGWQVVPMEQLLFAAARVGPKVRVEDNVGGSGVGIVYAFTKFPGFPWKDIPHTVSEMGVERARLDRGFDILNVLTELVSALPVQLLPVSGEPVDLALSLITTIRQHLGVWRTEIERDCDCGCV
jgi:hypothetical protein